VVTVLSTPVTMLAGSSFSVSDTTANQGAGRADASTTKFYLSTNTALDASDTLLGSRSVPDLLPGASHAGTATLTVPANTAGGNYYVIAQADGGTAVAETAESNNTKLGSAVKVGADLIVGLLKVPGFAKVGAINVTESTTNQGAGPLADSSTGFYLSTNSVFDAGDLFLGARSVGVLANGATSSGVTSLQIPAGTVAGSYYIVAKADWADVISETVESNNTRVANIFIGPDLLQESINAPLTVAAGASFLASDVVSNQGADTMPASTTQYYLSTNSSVDAGDVLLGSRPVAAVAPGTSNGGSVTLVIPTQTPAGKYFIVAAADGAGLIPEALENNNTYARNITITAAP